MSNYDMKIHANPDAAAWARFFMETKERQGWTIEDIDEDLMIAWFANAMMAMHDHVHTECDKENAALKASHAELVEALAEVKEYIGHLKMGSKHQEMRESLHLSAIYTIAQAALNKAREVMG